MTQMTYHCLNHNLLPHTKAVHVIAATSMKSSVQFVMCFEHQHLSVGIESWNDRQSKLVLSAMERTILFIVHVVCFSPLVQSHSSVFQLRTSMAASGSLEIYECNIFRTSFTGKMPWTS